MNTELVKVDPKEFGLDELQAVSIEQAFMPKIAERDGYAQIYEQLITKELTPTLCSDARELRLKLVKTRTGIADIHKTQKAFFLAAGKFVDAWKNRETLPVEQMEEKLAEIERHFENIEKERIAKLESERLELTKQFTEYPASGLGFMADVVFDSYLLGLKVAYNAKIKAEQETEAERLRLIEVERENARLKAIEDERIRLENEKLKAEAIEREMKAEAERNKQQMILAQERAGAKAKQDAIELAAKIEREKAEVEHKRLELQLLAKQADEQRAKDEADRKEAERIAAEKKASTAPDREKLIKMVESISITIPELNDATSIAVSNVIKAKFEAFKMWAQGQIKSL